MRGERERQTNRQTSRQTDSRKTTPLKPMLAPCCCPTRNASKRDSPKLEHAQYRALSPTLSSKRLVSSERCCYLTFLRSNVTYETNPTLKNTYLFTYLRASLTCRCFFRTNIGAPATCSNGAESAVRNYFSKIVRFEKVSVAAILGTS